MSAGPRARRGPGAVSCWPHGPPHTWTGVGNGWRRSRSFGSLRARRGQERRRFDAAQGLTSAPSAPLTAPTRPLSSLPSSGLTSPEQPPRPGKSRPRTQASPQTLLSQCRSVTRRGTKAMKKTVGGWPCAGCWTEGRARSKSRRRRSRKEVLDLLDIGLGDTSDTRIPRTI